MINARELRIGNLVMVKEKVISSTMRKVIEGHVVSSFDIDQIVKVHTISDLLNEQHADNISGDIWGIEYENCNGIPLTEEWLIKFGFIKISEISFHMPINEHKYFTMVYSKNAKKYTFPYTHGIDTLISFEYVHQLQNLYFALTGTELEIK
jgi:hypothetical protein